MSGTFGNGFGSNPFGGKGFDISGLGQGLSQGLGEAFEKLRTTFEQRTPAAGGDARSSILALLAERAMHGSELIQEIGARTGGSYTPTAGDVYPTLQLLVDEGLVTWEDTDGRRLYSLTEAGVAVAAESAPAWGEKASSEKKFGERATALGSAGFELAQAVAQVGRTGSSEQVAEAVAILDEARRRVHSLLAQD